MVAIFTGALVLLLFYRGERLEFWVNNAKTTEKIPKQVNVLRKLTELWAGAVLWRHSVFKFDNCAGLVFLSPLGSLKLFQNFPCSSVELQYNILSWSDAHKTSRFH